MPIIDDVKASMRRAEKSQSKWSIEVMEIDATKCDHIHLLVRSTPTVLPLTVVKTLKQYSCYDMWKNHEAYMKKWYWKKHYLWTRGYFLCTIGEASEKTIKRYIEDQG
jgi:putative transposase